MRETFGIQCVAVCLVKTGLQDFSSCKTKLLANIPPLILPEQNRPLSVISSRNNLHTEIKMFFHILILTHAKHILHIVPTDL